MQTKLSQFVSVIYFDYNLGKVQFCRHYSHWHKQLLLSFGPMKCSLFLAARHWPPSRARTCLFSDPRAVLWDQEWSGRTQNCYQKYLSNTVTLYFYATALKKLMNIGLNREWGRRADTSKGWHEHPNSTIAIQIKMSQIWLYIPKHAL